MKAIFHVGWQAVPFSLLARNHKGCYTILSILSLRYPFERWKRANSGRKVAVTSGSNIHHLLKGEGSLNQPQSPLRGDKHI